jgi:inositol-phosphate phosphatase/L-galactose 1-phosphate phosphatase/histidinol-phosphatase
VIEFETFTTNVLIPKASEVLSQYYQAYCAGEDIGVEAKADASPASRADREAEKALRALINAQYPEHGIWGEEFGGEDLDAEYVWVLDPLDGTKQFLAKQEGCFVVLIGVFKDKKPYFGAASDPLSGEVWIEKQSVEASDVKIKDMAIASTAPGTMFNRHRYQSSILGLFSDARQVVTCRNAKSFLDVIDGSVDVGIESDLSIHDIGALIPICQQAGCIVTDFEGNDYSVKSYEFNRDKYDFLVTRNEETTHKIIEYIRK